MCLGICEIAEGTMSRTWFAAAATALLTWSVTAAEAQIPGTYPPPGLNRPLMSPYFQLFRDDTGILPNYYQFYRPARTVQQGFWLQNRAIQSQQAEIRGLTQQLNTAQQTQVAPTGTGSVFMNYSHYYPMQGGSVGGGGRPSWSPRASTGYGTGESY
jgi:hypothetical protein